MVEYVEFVHGHTHMWFVCAHVDYHLCDMNAIKACVSARLSAYDTSAAG